MTVPSGLTTWPVAAASTRSIDSVRVRVSMRRSVKPLQR
jgi:hypothetical protein